MSTASNGSLSRPSRATCAYIRETSAQSFRAEEIIKTAKHVSAVIDGTIHDTFRPDPFRCVYGAWQLTRGAGNPSNQMKTKDMDNNKAMSRLPKALELIRELVAELEQAQPPVTRALDQSVS
jgi:hypothetical protein